MVARSKEATRWAILVLSFHGLLLPLHSQVLGADAREALHQRILAGDQIYVNASAPEATRTINANWIKEAVMKHVRIQVRNAIIQGRLDLQDSSVEQEFDLAGCILRDYADLSHATFKRDFFASDVVFVSGVSFQSTTFEHKATFQRTRFRGDPIIFEDAHFLAEFNAEEATFGSKGGGTAVFTHARFDAMADFAMSVFNINAHFITAQFVGSGYFPGARFGGSADFSRAHFLDIVTFGGGPPAKFNATFTGQALFVETHFDSTALFNRVFFESDVHFSTARFGSVAEFRGATFKANCDFSIAWFMKDGSFLGAKFLGQTDFYSAHFGGSLLFQAEEPLPAATFRGDAQFTNAEVENSVNFGGGAEFLQGVVFARKSLFNGAKFDGISNFQGVEFKGDTWFVGARLGNDAYFLGTTFEGDAVFDRAQILGGALFSTRDGTAISHFMKSSHFVHEASFSGAHFGSGVRFRGVRFDNTADFVGTHFDSDAHFEGAVFQGPTSFRSAIFHAVYFSPARTPVTQQFGNDVDLLGCTYDRIQIDWRSLLLYPNGQSRIRPYDRGPYIQLEEVLRKSGSDRDADAVYAERYRVENLNSKGLRRVEGSLFWLIANYGINLWHEFILTLLVLVIGMVIFTRPRAVLVGVGKLETKISWYQALPLAIHQFLPFSLPAKPQWTPSEQVLCSLLPWPFRRATSYANFLQIVGWILIPLAAAQLAGVLRHVPQ